MTVHSLAAFWPEWLLLLGACLTLLVGIGDRGRRPSGTPLFALLVVAAALLMTWRQGPLQTHPALPGLWITPLTYYARWITLGMGVLILLVNWHQPAAPERGEYLAMILFSLLGVLLTASANNLLVLFFAIELVSVPTYVLIALSRTDARAAESALKYFFLGAMAAAVLAFGLVYLYGASGTMDLYGWSAEGAVSHFAFGASMGATALIGVVLVFAGLAFKIAAVPLHVYAADVYEGAASPVTGMLGFVPKFAGFLALVKLFGAMGWTVPPAIFWMIWLVAAATMTVGNALGLLQKNVKRMLAYSSIAHTGYMLIALLVGPVLGRGPMHDGVAALLFYIAIYGAMNLGAFAALASVQRDGHDVETMADLAGLARRAPWASLALAVCVFSLMGFPPTAGFLGKVYIFSSAFSVSAEHPYWKPMVVLAVIGVVNSAIAAAYYLRIVAAVYVHPERGTITPVGGAAGRFGLALCAMPMLVLFTVPGMISERARSAATAVEVVAPSTPIRVTQASPKPKGLAGDHEADAPGSGESDTSRR